MLVQLRKMPCICKYNLYYEHRVRKIKAKTCPSATKVINSLQRQLPLKITKVIKVSLNDVLTFTTYKYISYFP